MNDIIDMNIERIAAINEFSSAEELKFKHKNRHWDGFVYFNTADGIFIPEGKEPVIIKNSTLIFLNTSDSYSIYLKPGYRYIASAYRILKDESYALPHLLPRSHACSRNEEAAIENIYRTWCKNKRHSAMDCRIQILSLYLEFIKKSSDNTEGDDKVNRAIDFIHANFRRNFTASEIASFCNTSESHLRAVFRKSTGMTILGFRELQRINEAKQMLSTSLFSQKEIAYELGYHDVYHFSKAFKKITGFTPGKYEKQG